MTQLKSTKKKNKPTAADPAVAWPYPPQELSASLLQWRDESGRHGLPWTPPPGTDEKTAGYMVAVSEVMMQQTTVAVGLKRFPRWMARFPSWNELAAATLDDVMKEWEGLGYYARARALHKMAQKIVFEHQGLVPRDRADRLALPGVGPSTASALACFVYHTPEAIWDANVNRVWRRWWGDLWPENSDKNWPTSMAQQALPKSGLNVAHFTQAIMDLGATVCTSKNPQCAQCPWQTSCRANALGEPTRWPPPKAPTKVQEMEKKWAWVIKDGKVAALRPQAKGVWSGLFALPEFNPSPASPPLASGQHKLSHRNVSWSVHVSPLQSHRKTLASYPDQLVWMSVSDFEASAWPAPIRAWWSKLTMSAKAALFS